MSADEPEKKKDLQGERMAMGIAFGVPVGVAISLVLDNWAMLGVGIALGAAFGAVPVSGKDAGGSTGVEDAGTDEDDRPVR